MTKLNNQVAVVTGSSRGIGRAIALRLAAAGANVLVHANRSRQEANDVAAQIQANGRKATVVTCDLADADATNRFVEQAFDWQSKVDIWVNNAGFDSLTGDAARLPFDSKLERLWQTDVLGTIRCCRSAGARMKAAGQGHIINIGWDQAWHGMEVMTSFQCCSANAFEARLLVTDFMKAVFKYMKCYPARTTVR